MQKTRIKRDDPEKIAKEIELLDRIVTRDYKRLTNTLLRMFGANFPGEEPPFFSQFIDNSYLYLASQIREGYLVEGDERKMGNYLLKGAIWLAIQEGEKDATYKKRYTSLIENYHDGYWEGGAFRVPTKGEQYQFLRDVLQGVFPESVIDIYLMWLHMKVFNIPGGMEKLKKVGFVSENKTRDSAREVKKYLLKNQRKLWDLFQTSHSS